MVPHRHCEVQPAGHIESKLPPAPEAGPRHKAEKYPAVEVQRACQTAVTSHAATQSGPSLACLPQASGHYEEPGTSAGDPCGKAV